MSEPHASLPPAPSLPPKKGFSGLLVLKVLGGAIVGATVGTGIGVAIGRLSIESGWSKPPIVLSAADEKRASANDADPTPKAGSTVMRAMPIGRMRAALSPITAKDPVVATVVSIGAGDEGNELHVVVENHGKCATVTGLSGVAYGFTATGRSAALNRNGEHYVAFEATKLKLEPGAHDVVAAKLRYAEASTLGLAQIDSVTCADGTTWKRH